MLPHQDQHSKHYFHEKNSETFVLKKNGHSRHSTQPQQWSVRPSGATTSSGWHTDNSRFQKGKDTITAIVFIQIIDDLARTNNWSNTVTHKNVANTLRGFPWDWLLQPSKCWTRKEISSPRWTSNRRFQHQFANQTDDKPGHKPQWITNGPWWSLRRATRPITTRWPPLSMTLTGYTWMPRIPIGETIWWTMFSSFSRCNSSWQLYREKSAMWLPRRIQQK